MLKLRGCQLYVFLIVLLCLGNILAYQFTISTQDKWSTSSYTLPYISNVATDATEPLSLDITYKLVYTPSPSDVDPPLLAIEIFDTRLGTIQIGNQFSFESLTAAETQYTPACGIYTSNGAYLMEAKFTIVNSSTISFVYLPTRAFLLGYHTGTAQFSIKCSNFVHIVPRAANIDTYFLTNVSQAVQFTNTLTNKIRVDTTLITISQSSSYVSTDYLYPRFARRCRLSGYADVQYGLCNAADYENTYIYQYCTTPGSATEYQPVIQDCVDVATNTGGFPSATYCKVPATAINLQRLCRGIEDITITRVSIQPTLPVDTLVTLDDVAISWKLSSNIDYRLYAFDTSVYSASTNPALSLGIVSYAINSLSLSYNLKIDDAYLTLASQESGLTFVIARLNQGTSTEFSPRQRYVFNFALQSRCNWASACYSLGTAECRPLECVCSQGYTGDRCQYTYQAMQSVSGNLTGVQPPTQSDDLSPLSNDQSFAASLAADNIIFVDIPQGSDTTWVYVPSSTCDIVHYFTQRVQVSCYDHEQKMEVSLDICQSLTRPKILSFCDLAHSPVPTDNNTNFALACPYTSLPDDIQSLITKYNTNAMPANRILPYQCDFSPIELPCNGGCFCAFEPADYPRCGYFTPIAPVPPSVAQPGQLYTVSYLPSELDHLSLCGMSDIPPGTLESVIKTKTLVRGSFPTLDPESCAEIFSIEYSPHTTAPDDTNPEQVYQSSLSISSTSVLDLSGYVGFIKFSLITNYGLANEARHPLTRYTDNESDFELVVGPYGLDSNSSPVHFILPIDFLKDVDMETKDIYVEGVFQTYYSVDEATVDVSKASPPIIKVSPSPYTYVTLCDDVVCSEDKICSIYTGQCECYPGYSGDACDIYQPCDGAIGVLLPNNDGCQLPQFDSLRFIAASDFMSGDIDNEIGLRWSYKGHADNMATLYIVSPILPTDYLIKTGVTLVNGSTSFTLADAFFSTTLFTPQQRDANQVILSSLIGQPIHFRLVMQGTSLPQYSIVTPLSPSYTILSRCNVATCATPGSYSFCNEQEVQCQCNPGYSLEKTTPKYQCGLECLCQNGGACRHTTPKNAAVGYPEYPWGHASLDTIQSQPNYETNQSDICSCPAPYYGEYCQLTPSCQEKCDNGYAFITPGGQCDASASCTCYDLWKHSIVDSITCSACSLVGMCYTPGTSPLTWLPGRCKKCVCADGYSGPYCSRRTVYSTILFNIFGVKSLADVPIAQQIDEAIESPLGLLYDRQRLVDYVHARQYLRHKLSVVSPLANTNEPKTPSLADIRVHSALVTVISVDLDLTPSDLYIYSFNTSTWEVVLAIQASPESDAIDALAISDSSDISPLQTPDITVRDLYTRWTHLIDNFDQSHFAGSSLFRQLNGARLSQLYDPLCLGGPDCPSGTNPFPVLGDRNNANRTRNTIIISVIVAFIVSVAACLIIGLAVCHRRELYCFSPEARSLRQNRRRHRQLSVQAMTATDEPPVPSTTPNVPQRLPVMHCPQIVTTDDSCEPVDETGDVVESPQSNNLLARQMGALQYNQDFRPTPAGRRPRNKQSKTGPSAVAPQTVSDGAAACSMYNSAYAQSNISSYGAYDASHHDILYQPVSSQQQPSFTNTIGHAKSPKTYETAPMLKTDTNSENNDYNRDITVTRMTPTVSLSMATTITTQTQQSSRHSICEMDNADYNHDEHRHHSHNSNPTDNNITHSNNNNNGTHHVPAPLDINTTHMVRTRSHTHCDVSSQSPKLTSASPRSTEGRSRPNQADDDHNSMDDVDSVSDPHYVPEVSHNSSNCAQPVSADHHASYR